MYQPQFFICIFLNSSYTLFASILVMDVMSIAYSIHYFILVMYARLYASCLYNAIQQHNCVARNLAENETIYLIVHHPFIIFLGGMQL